MLHKTMTDSTTFPNSSNEKDIVMTARSLIDECGEQAEDTAMARMFEAMEKEDVAKASLWMAVIQEIRLINHSSPRLN